MKLSCKLCVPKSRIVLEITGMELRMATCMHTAITITDSCASVRAVRHPSQSKLLIGLIVGGMIDSATLTAHGASPVKVPTIPSAGLGRAARVHTRTTADSSFQQKRENNLGTQSLAMRALLDGLRTQACFN